jgi:hypothetical protein
MTLRAILKEMKGIPANRLEEVYQYVHSLNPTTKKTDNQRKKILSFGGAFSDMNEKNYNSFLNETKKTRKKLFDRETGL